jgi:ribosomal protein L37AE/L43A
MLGYIDRDDKNLHNCPYCNKPMILTCYGGFWLCKDCDYIELATDSMNKQANIASAQFLHEHKNHSNLCICDTCKLNNRGWYKYLDKTGKHKCCSKCHFAMIFDNDNDKFICETCK